MQNTASQKHGDKHIVHTVIHHPGDNTPAVEKIQLTQIQDGEVLTHLQKQGVNTVVQEEQEEEGGLQQLLHQLTILTG